MALHEAHGGGEETGFMREVDGRTVQLHDYRHKRRRDYTIGDRDILEQARERFGRCVVPELLKAFQYKATRMERYIVSCYRAEDGGRCSS